MRAGLKKNSDKTALVFITTLFAALLEVFFGNKLNSHALLSEGWHMMFHALLIFMALTAYFFKQKNASFILNISAFNLSIVLLLVSAHTLIGSFKGLYEPSTIHPNYALALQIALIGLGIHLINFFVLKHHDHHHPPKSDCVDHNIKAIYLHVLGDLFTVVLTILAIIMGLWFDYDKADNIAGMISASIVILLVFRLMRAQLKSIKHET